MDSPDASVAFPASAAAQLRCAVNQTDDPARLKAMLSYIADNLELSERGVHCAYCPVLRSPRPGPPCVVR